MYLLIKSKIITETKAWELHYYGYVFLFGLIYWSAQLFWLNKIEKVYLFCFSFFGKQSNNNFTLNALNSLNLNYYLRKSLEPTA